MRRTALLLAGSALAAMPLAAQFEGTIHMKMATSDKDLQGTEMTWMIKGSRIAYTMQSPMAPGAEMRMILDESTQKGTMLIPMSGQMAGMAAVPGMADAKGIMFTMDMNQARTMAGKSTPPTFKDLGTSETIAGYKCEDFDMTDGKDVTRMCTSHDIGAQFMFSAGRGSGPSWATKMPPNFGFPLKVTTHDGKVSMEVTSVQKGSIPESAFAIPDGYKDMSAMAGMMGGRGRGGPQ